jgi:hypothetical protein
MDLNSHNGHIINMKPFFSAVVPGKSGTVEPDWTKAPNPGDRIHDGTVVWENVGQIAFCVTCGKEIGKLLHAPGAIN